MEALSEEQRRQMSSSQLTHPWIIEPVTKDIVSLCEDTIDAMPVMIGNWVFKDAVCKADSFTANYERRGGGTNVGYLSAFEDVFPENANTNIVGDESASVSFAMKMRVGTDNMDQFPDNARDKFVSHFQKRSMKFSLERVASKALVPSYLPNGDPWPTDAPAPKAKWTTYAFGFTSAERPSETFKGLFPYGVRPMQLNVEFKSESQSFVWTTVGKLYEK